MRNLLVIKDWYQDMYRKYGTFIEIGLKLAVSLLAVILLNVNIGTMAVLNNPVIVIGIAVICALVPKSIMVLILAAVIVAHFAAISIEMAAFILVLLFIMFLLYFRFSAGDSMVLILVPVLFMINIPFVVPVAMGLLATPFSIVSVACGSILYFMLRYVHMNLETLTDSSVDGLTGMTDMAREVFTSESLYLVLISFSIALAAVYVLRKLSIRNAWEIAVCAGIGIQAVILLIGNLVVRIDVFTIPALVIGSIISLLLAMMLAVMRHNVDYARTEYTQFEDDDYYYYVKAVPKIKTREKNSSPRAQRNRKKKR